MKLYLNLLALLLATALYGASYEYDTLNRLTAAHLDNGEVLRYTYDIRGNLLNVSSSTNAAAPVITQLPQSQTVLEGESLNFTIGAAGAQGLQYQWQFNGVDIPGATQAELSLTAVTAASAGAYRCIVTGNGKSTISPSFMITVNPTSRVLYATDFDSHNQGRTLDGQDGWYAATYDWSFEAKPISTRQTGNAVWGGEQYYTSAPGSLWNGQVGAVGHVLSPGVASSFLGFGLARDIQDVPGIGFVPSEREHIVNFSADTHLYNLWNPTDVDKDYFGWVAYNQNREPLFALLLHSVSGVAYVLNKDVFKIVPTGRKLPVGKFFHTDITMDFALNRWSASVDGSLVVINQPISTSGVAVNLKGIAPLWFYESAAGSNEMLFDNYKISIPPSTAPSTGINLAASSLVGMPAGMRLPGRSQLFKWNAVPRATAYRFSIGSAYGGSDIFQSGVLTTTQMQVNNLPMDGRALYVRVESSTNGGTTWTHNPIYTDQRLFAALSRKARLIRPTDDPADNVKLASGPTTFVWDEGTGVTAYELWVGSTAGGNDLASQMETGANRVRVLTLPTDGRTLHVTLRSRIDGVMEENRYTLTATGNPTPPSSNTNLADWTASGDGVVMFPPFIQVPGSTHYFFTTVTAEDPQAKIKLNSVPVAQGELIGPLAAPRGSTPITVEITSADGFATNLYTYTIQRSVSDADEPVIAETFADGLSGTTPPPTLLKTGPGKLSFVPGASLFPAAGFARFEGLAPAGRCYLRTVLANYATLNWVTADFTWHAANSNPGHVFFGMGQGMPDSSFDSEPRGGGVPYVYARLKPESPASAQSFVTTSNGLEHNQGAFDPGPGTHRGRMIWDGFMKRVTFQFDLNSGTEDGTVTGDGFTVDYQFVENVSSSGFDATNSAIFFGSSDGTLLDYFAVDADGDESEIMVMDFSGNEIANKSTKDIGAARIGEMTAKSFVISNGGLGNLTGVMATSDNSDFVITSSPASRVTAVDGSTVFTVRFAPGNGALGPRTGKISIASNDSDENPFVINVGGTATAGIAPKLALSSTSVTVSEDIGTLNLPVIRTGNARGIVTAKVTVTNGTAKSGTDFVVPPTLVTLGDKVSRGMISVPILKSPEAEPLETFIVTLSAPTGGASLGAVPTTTVRIIDMVDNTAPGLTITSPAANANVLPSAGPTVKVTGTATDNQGVAQVQVQLNSGQFLDAEVTTAGASSTPYTLTVTPVPGTNTLRVKSIDYRGNTSAVVTRMFTYAVMGNLVVDLAGPANPPTNTGTISAPYGAPYPRIVSQQVGKAYTITATAKSTPAPGYLFSHWTVSGGPTLQEIGVTERALWQPSLKFIFREGLVLTGNFVVNPFGSVAGTYNGLVERDMSLSAPIASPAGQKLQGHGGSIENLVLSSTGAFTANLKLEDKSYTMPINSKIDAVEEGDLPATVTIKRGTGVADLLLQFAINRTTGELIGTITDGLPSSTPIPVRAWRNQWKTTATTTSAANPATSRAATYTAMLSMADSALQGDALYPQGLGYCTLMVTITGAASWAGVLADGTPFTYSTTMGPTGEVPLHVMLYTPTVAATAGSFHGWVQVSTGPDTTKPDDNLLDAILDLSQPNPKDRPMLDWLKKPQATSSTTRSYKAGIPQHKLNVAGGAYLKPAPGVRVLGLENTTDNAKLTFASADIESLKTYLNIANGGPTASLAGKRITITTANTLSPLAVANNPAALSLTINSATGAFSGSFTLKDDADPTDHLPPIAVLAPRIISYKGLLLLRAGFNKGYGQFQLPQLPSDGPPKTTLSTSPILSGQVIFEAWP